MVAASEISNKYFWTLVKTVELHIKVYLKRGFLWVEKEGKTWAR